MSVDDLARADPWTGCASATGSPDPKQPPQRPQRHTQARRVPLRAHHARGPIDRTRPPNPRTMRWRYLSHRTVHRHATIPAGALDRDGRYRKRRIELETRTRPPCPPPLRAGFWTPRPSGPIRCSSAPSGKTTGRVDRVHIFATFTAKFSCMCRSREARAPPRSRQASSRHDPPSRPGCHWPRVQRNGGPVGHAAQ